MAQEARETVEKAGINLDRLVDLPRAEQAAYYCSNARRAHLIRTCEPALTILHREAKHGSWFSEFLGEGPSGRFTRRGETSPFVSKFLR